MSVAEPKPLKPKSSRLDNGVTVVSVKLAHLSRAHVGVTLRGGPLHEDDRQWGMSHLVEHMVFRGTKTWTDARAVSEAADAFGGEIDASTFRDRVLYDTRCDPDSVQDALEVLCEMLSVPRFEGLDVEKGILKEELLESYDEEGQEIEPDNLAYRDLFRGSALARSIDGTAETLASFDMSMVKTFFARAYGAQHMVIVCAGPVAHAQVVAAAKATFGTLISGPPPLKGAPHGKGTPPKRARVVRTDDSQTAVRLVYKTGGLRSDDRWALSVLARVLDDGPSARIPARLIDEEGLAYDLWADLSLYEEAGTLAIGGAVQHDRVGTVVRGITRELERLLREPVGNAELSRIQDRARRDLVDLQDSPGVVVESLSRMALFDIPFETTEADEAVRKVEASDLRDLARRILRPDNAVLCLVGLPPNKQVRAAEDAVAALDGGSSR